MSLTILASEKQKSGFSEAIGCYENKKIEQERFF